MRTLAAAGLLLALVLLAGGAVAKPTSPAADPRRPAADMAEDARRKGPEIVAFADVKPGWKVGDLMQGAGYFTRLWVAAAGPKGKVYAWSPPQFIAVKKTLYGDSLDTLSHDYPGLVVAMREPFDALAFPEPLDLVFTSQNYHDLHLKALPADTAAKLNAAVFKALKPGGEYLIVDHVAKPGTPDAENTVHRIDPAVLRREVEAAGFRYEGESPALRNPADDGSLMVMNPAIRGRTDQLIYRFRKRR